MDTHAMDADRNTEALPGPITVLGPGEAAFSGPAGSLPILARDRVTLKVAMLYEGECAGLGAVRAAAKYGYSRQGYYRLLHQFRTSGAAAFLQRPGPKTQYRRGERVVRAVVRLRFQTPEASAPEIARALRADGLQVSGRSVQRIFSDYGLQQRDYPKTRARPHSLTDGSAERRRGLAGAGLTGAALPRSGGVDMPGNDVNRAQIPAGEATAVGLRTQARLLECIRAHNAVDSRVWSAVH